MKKLILAAVAALAFCTIANAQMYDGITQPTKYRVWLMTNIPASAGADASFTPFVGYRQDIAPWLNVTGWAQYNFSSKTFTPAIWFNFNIAGKFYVLSRSIWDIKTSNYRHGLAATWKIAGGFHTDCTWDNLLNNGKFAEGDRLQVLAGWGGKKVVVNAGYSMRTLPGFVCNVRYKLTDMLWSQLKYDGGTDAFAFSLVYHWN